MARRVFLIVLDSVGVGEAPDAERFDDVGCDTFGTCVRSGNLHIPVMESLLLKGLPLGTTLAFCMSTVAASLPEVLMLKQVMSWKLLAVFLGMLLIIFTLVGWLFNLLHMQNF